VDDTLAKNNKIDSMVSYTGLDREIAYFYLESTLWNIDDALRLYQESN
jgi:hypothetical protein